MLKEYVFFILRGPGALQSDYYTGSSLELEYGLLSHSSSPLEYLWMAMMLGFWARSVLIIWSEVQGGEGAL